MSLSYSQLQLYRRCPKQYEFAVIKKLGKQISAGESFGSSMHNTLKRWGDLEVANARSAEQNQLQLFIGDEEKKPQMTLQLLHELWHQNFIVEGYANRAEADAARKRGQDALDGFFDWWTSQNRTVLAVEKGFEVQIDDTVIAGRLDRVEAIEDGLHIIDYKTGVPRSQDEVDADLQLSIYAMGAQQLFGKPCTKLTLLFLGDEKLVEMHTERREGQIKDAKTQIRSLIERLESKDFHPTPSREKCRGCPYRTVCSAAAV